MLARMIGNRTFGRLGKRSAARLEITIAGGLATTSQSLSCRVENISGTGCCFAFENPDRAGALRVGADVMVKVERIETMGRVAWINRGRCGVTFARPLPQDKLARLRWIVDHPERHEQNAAKTAARSWR